MTELLTRPDRSRAEVVDFASSLWWRAALAAAWAVAVGVAALVVVVLVAWAADSRAGAGVTDAIRSALQIWLVAHRVPLSFGEGSIAVAPLLLTLGLAALVARSAAVLARGPAVSGPRDVIYVAAAVGLPYAGLTTFVAAAATSATVRPSPVGALLGGLVVGCTAAGWGAARGAGLVGECWRRIPSSVRPAIAGGAIGVAVWCAGGALLLAAGIVLHVADAARMTSALGGGWVAGVALVALDVALLPNAAVFAASYVAGPGFALGAASSVSMTGAHETTLPALPLLAAVPTAGASASVVVVALVVLLASGAAAGWTVARTTAGSVVASGLGAGAVAGVLAAVLAAAAGGPAGPGGMATVGPSPWLLGVALAGEIGVVAPLVAVLSRRRRP